MADDGGDFVWNGVLDPAQLIDSVVAAGHRLADAAKMGEWSTVFRMLDEYAQVNWWRPGGTAWFTVLHQAAWHGVSAEVAQELIDRGALRTQTDSRARTAYDVAMERHATAGRQVDALCEVLLPPSASLPPHRVQALDRHLAEVIDGRIKGVLYDGLDPRAVLRYPPVGILHELPGQRLWFPVPGMYGGFRLALRGDELHAASWCRVVGGSGQHHLITHHGATLVDEGFV